MSADRQTAEDFGSDLEYAAEHRATELRRELDQAAADQTAHFDRRATEIAEYLALAPVAAGMPLLTPPSAHPHAQAITDELRNALSGLDNAMIVSITSATSRHFKTVARASAEWICAKSGLTLLRLEARRRGIHPGLPRGPRHKPEVTARARLQDSLRGVYRDHGMATRRILCAITAAGQAQTLQALQHEPRQFGRLLSEASNTEKLLQAVTAYCDETGT